MLPSPSTATDEKADAALPLVGVRTHSADRATLFTVFDALAVAVAVCVPVVDVVPVAVGVAVAVLVLVAVDVLV
jgi:hypothetical protein